MKGEFSLPPVGFGCSPFRDGDRVDLGDSIEVAVETGYQLLDTAEAYGNEAEIGEILGRLLSLSSRPLIVSKVWQTHHAYKHVLAACENSLRRLRIDALDLYLIHAPEAWPYTGPLVDPSPAFRDDRRWRNRSGKGGDLASAASVPLEETWSAMEELSRRGLARAIGVSNFERADLEAVLAGAAIPPAVNQIERHPYRPRADLVRFCRQQEIRVMAHSPLSKRAFLEEPVVRAIARRHGKSPAQVVLRWNIELGIVPIPSSRNAEHISENLQVFDFALEAKETAQIDALSRVSGSEAC